MFGTESEAMFEFDVKGNLIVDEGVHIDRRYYNANFIKIGGVYYKCVSRPYRDGKKLAEALVPVEKYVPDDGGHTERNPIILEMLYHVAIKGGPENA